MKSFIVTLLFLIVGACSAGAQEIVLRCDVSRNLSFGHAVPIGFDIVGRNGDTLRTQGFLNGTLAWRKLRVKVEGGTLHRGMLCIDRPKVVTPSCAVRLHVVHKESGLSQDLVLPLLFNSEELASYKPLRKRDSGSRFNPLYILLSLFGTYSHGLNGKDGRDGDNGENLVVDLSRVSINSHAILKVDIKSSKGTCTHYINPIGGRLVVSADGGDAGNGGDGWSGDPSKSYGGNGGNGGNGGCGGSIFVNVTEEAKPLMGCVQFRNGGGAAGRGGRGGNGYYLGDNGANGFKGMDGPKISFLKKQ